MNEAWFLAFAAPDFDAIQLAWLPEDLQSRAQAILQPILDQEREANSKPGTRTVDPDSEQAHLERKIALLRPLLSPEQLEEYRWRTDPEIRTGARPDPPLQPLRGGLSEARAAG